ncbi:sulfotransferase [Streptosporangium sp. NPDC000396]|uniref:sulfotransferase n=1 Tax=Streptosporangium sp. NPDC000396 TaxID=3366185 RepID=UPI0036C4ACDE
MDTSPLKILCITGWCRNGSTIIGNILNEIPGFFHVGELHFLWKNSAGRGVNSLCGCGEVLTGCPIWSKIIPLGMPEGVSLEDFADTVIRRQRACVRTRHTWRVLDRGLHCDDIREHADLMTRTYHAIAERTGSRVIVDTTKIPGEAALLPRLEGVTPYYVHLVRDPRAVAHSWREPKQYVYAMSSSMSTAYWHGFNLASQAITRRHPGRSLFLRYERFIADPAGTIDALLRFCDADPDANPVRDRTVELHTNHTVTGNPDRFRTGVTVIRDRDDSWKTGLSVSAKLAAATLSWPLFRRYGYGYDGTLLAGPRRADAATPQATKEQ